MVNTLSQFAPVSHIIRQHLNFYNKLRFDKSLLLKVKRIKDFIGGDLKRIGTMSVILVMRIVIMAPYSLGLIHSKYVISGIFLIAGCPNFNEGRGRDSRSILFMIFPQCIFLYIFGGLWVCIVGDKVCSVWV